MGTAKYSKQVQVLWMCRRIYWTLNVEKIFKSRKNLNLQWVIEVLKVFKVLEGLRVLTIRFLEVSEVLEIIEFL